MLCSLHSSLIITGEVNMRNNVCEFPNAKCVVCGIRAFGKKDFLCENCTHPEKIITYCVSCKEYMEINIVQLAQLLKIAENEEIPASFGVSIKMNACNKCFEKDGKFRVEFYKMGNVIKNRAD